MFQWRKFQFFDKETLQEEDGKEDLKVFQVRSAPRSLLVAASVANCLRVCIRSSLQRAARLAEDISHLEVWCPLGASWHRTFVSLTLQRVSLCRWCRPDSPGEQGLQMHEVPSA